MGLFVLHLAKTSQDGPLLKQRRHDVQRLTHRVRSHPQWTRCVPTCANCQRLKLTLPVTFRFPFPFYSPLGKRKRETRPLFTFSSKPRNRGPENHLYMVADGESANGQIPKRRNHPIPIMKTSQDFQKISAGVSLFILALGFSSIGLMSLIHQPLSGDSLAGPVAPQR